MDLKDTLDEIRTIVYNCIERRERSRPHTPAAPATFDQCRLSSVCVDVRIARKDEREQFAKSLKTRLRKTWEEAKEKQDDPEWDKLHSFSLPYLEKEIDKSLRGGAEQGGSER
jgi:hypothetical protein